MISFEKGMDLAFKTPLYAKLYKELRINRNDIKCVKDLIKLPTVSKEDIVKDYAQAIAKPEQVFKFHTTSGSSGTPTIVGFTQNDWHIYVRQNVKCLELIGVNNQDIIYNATSYGMFFAGLVLHDASVALGCKIIPAGVLSSIEAHIELIKTFKPTVFIGIPQYLLKLGKSCEDDGIDPRDLGFKIAYCLGEPLPDQKRKTMENMCDIDIYCGYGLSEVGAGAECCEKRGYHWPIHDVLVEVLDKKNGKGELTYTTLTKTGTIAIRYRSKDLGSIIDEPCPCGEKTPLISHIEERLDDLVKIKGTLISPYAVESAIYSFKEIDTYLFVINNDTGFDEVSVYVEGNNIDTLKLKNVIYSKTFITPNSIKIVKKDSIPLIGRKGKRFIDLRKENNFNSLVRKFTNANYAVN